LLEAAPATEREKKLMDALRESEARADALKDRVIGLQATAVLQDLYVDRVRGQLQGQEEKK
jgi:hypothetical protein